MARRIFLRDGGSNQIIPPGYKSVDISQNSKLTISTSTSSNSVDSYLNSVTVSGTNLIFNSLGSGFTGTISLSSLSATGGSSNIPSYLNIGSSSLNPTINLSNAKIQEIYLDNNPTFSFSNPIEGFEHNLLIKQDRAKTISWPSGIIWENQTSPSTLSAFMYHDPDFTGTGFNGIVSSMALQSDGKILVGGNFTSYNSTSINRIVRLTSTGSLDSSFSVGTGFNGVVSDIKIQSDGRILCGGAFTTYNGATWSRIARLNSNGSIDSNFVGTFSVGFNTGSVFSIGLQNDGKIVCGGSFTSYRGTTVNRITRITSTGSLDTSLAVIGTGFNTGQVNKVQTLSDGGILAVGTFTNFDGLTSSRIAKLTPKNNVYTYSEDLSNAVWTKTALTTTGYLNVATGPDGTLTGDKLLETIANTPHFVTRVTTPLVSGVNYNISVHLKQAERTRVQILSNMSGATQSCELDLTNGNVSNNSFTNTPVVSSETNGWYRFSTTIRSGVASSTTPMRVTIMNGALTSYVGTTTNGVLFWGAQMSESSSVLPYERVVESSSFDSTFLVGTGLNGTASTVEFQADGKFLVGGQFTTYTGVTSSSLVRINTNGSIDGTFSTSLGTGFNGNIITIATQSNGNTILGGAFTTYKGLTNSNSRINRINSSTAIQDEYFSIGSGFNNSVNSIVVQPDGKILVSGAFTTFNGITRNYITRLISYGDFYLRVGITNDGTYYIGKY
jgi:uncharacterized delta-60 repeat protein